jgi:hypothetical protein
VYKPLIALEAINDRCRSTLTKLLLAQHKVRIGAAIGEQEKGTLKGGIWFAAFDPWNTCWRQPAGAFNCFDVAERSGLLGPTNAARLSHALLRKGAHTAANAHCYESDKSQPGKPWYARSLAFHGWVSSALKVTPADLAREIDWLFVAACKDLAAAVLRREEKLTKAAAKQRTGYNEHGFPEPGADPELALLISEELKPFLAREPSDDVWRTLTQRIRQFLSVQNKRKNLVGEGFEDVLAQIVRRACDMQDHAVLTRKLLYEIPGFNRAKQGGKENKVDLAIVRPSMRTIVTAKWSVRADREKQFPTEYEEYCNAESKNEKFQYVFVTNEFDPARLMRACDMLFRNNPMFDYVVHINTEAVMAAYGEPTGEDRRSGLSRRRVIEHIENGRLVSLERWLNVLRQY